MNRRNGIAILFVTVPALCAFSFSYAQSVPGGKELFEAQCSSCHNADSTEAKDGPGLKGVRNGKLPSGKPATHDSVLEIVNEGRQVMPSFKEILTKEQKEDVIAYVLSL